MGHRQRAQPPAARQALQRREQQEAVAAAEPVEPIAPMRPRVIKLSDSQPRKKANPGEAAISGRPTPVLYVLQGSVSGASSASRVIGPYAVVAATEGAD